jgi:hypothetical protein
MNKLSSLPSHTTNTSYPLNINDNKQVVYIKKGFFDYEICYNNIVLKQIVNNCTIAIQVEILSKLYHKLLKPEDITINDFNNIPVFQQFVIISNMLKTQDIAQFFAIHMTFPKKTLYGSSQEVLYTNYFIETGLHKISELNDAIKTVLEDKTYLQKNNYYLEQKSKLLVTEAETRVTKLEQELNEAQECISQLKQELDNANKRVAELEKAVKPIVEEVQKQEEVPVQEQEKVEE